MKDQGRHGWYLRRLTAPGRALPDYIVLGAQKAGTAALFHYLSQHPQIIPSCVKEVHFFDGGIRGTRDTYRKGPLWYRAHFPLRLRLRSGAITGEASPLYLFDPRAAHRIHELVPSAKLIALLRNPVDRAISHYFHEVRQGRERRPLARALEEEEDVIQPLIAARRYDAPDYRHRSYRHRGLYAEQLRRYLRLFDRAQLLVLSSEEMLAQTENVLQRVFSFLGVAKSFDIPDLRPRHVARNKTSVDPAIRHDLARYFQTPDQDLYKLLDMDFGW